MRTVNFFRCGLCEQNFFDSVSCLDHELTHLNISRDIYEEWKRLKDSAEYNSRVIMRTKNEVTENAFNKAVERLIDFEKQYNIDCEQILKVG